MFSIESRLVSDAIWWNPTTWDKSHIETRRHWDMDATMTKEEMAWFFKDNFNEYGLWEKVPKRS
jgi:hypothetical protein